ncbi:hypothetical protein CR513_19794, partial [Mucuna pruriens]
MEVVNDSRGGIFFLYGYGGTASSGIASLLLPGGRAAHSKFVILFSNGIKYCFEALDKSLRHIMSSSNNATSLFRRKVIIFEGDFREILPLIPRESRYSIVNATINALYLWYNCSVLTLTKKIYVYNKVLTTSILSEVREFPQWILDICDAKLSKPNDGYASIEIPHSFLITDFDDPIDSISRVILASTIETVDEINDYETKNSSPEGLTHEILNSLRSSALPNHNIKGRNTNNDYAIELDLLSLE